MNTLEASGWLPVAELATGFDENKLPATDELAGKEFILNFGRDGIVKYSFQDTRNLVRETVNARENPAVAKEIYEAMQIAPGLYLVDYVKNKSRRESVTLVLDVQQRKAIVIDAVAPMLRQANRSFLIRMKQGLDLSPVRYAIHPASLDNSPARSLPALFPRTQDLIGKRVRYTYSRQHVYEHIYLNHRFYTWQCLAGPEKGTADTDVCDYFKIAPDIYLFIWREKVVPTIGVVIINFKSRRSAGKILGLDIPTGKAVNFTMGAYVAFVGEIPPAAPAQK